MNTPRQFRLIVRSILLSYTQIFFSDRLWFGLLLLAVSFFNMTAGFAGLLAVVISNGAAWLMGVNRPKIASGQYGFNSLLVGLGTGLYYQASPVLFLVVAFASLLTLFFTFWFEGLLAKYRLPFLSLPFLFGLWTVGLTAAQFSGLTISEAGVYTLNDVAQNTSISMLGYHQSFVDIFPRSLRIYFNSLGAVFFQYHLYAGILIALGLLLSSRISFMLSLYGFYLAYGYYHLVGGNFGELSYAYIGFNFILTAIAVGGFFVVPSWYSFLWVALLTPLLSFLITGSTAVLGVFHLSTFALPFNVAVILFLYALQFRERYFHRPQLVAVQKYSPERNLYAHLNFRHRFNDMPLISVYLPFFGRWKINQGHNGSYTHRDDWRHAWDFVIEDEGSEYAGRGEVPEDYYCYNKPVVAPADGVVEALEDGISDNTIGEVNLEQNWGNSIVIKHGPALYSQLSHLRAGSFRVQVGDSVKRGEVLAYCGNSGRSPVPHLHFQLQATPFVGSKTLPWPLALYYRYGDRQELMINTLPREGEELSNISHETALAAAFGFVPGQKILWTCEEQQVQWEAGIDFYGNTYLYDAESTSYAFFGKSDDELVFKDFTGDKKSLLFAFYLSAYHVVFTWNDMLEIKDVLPANTFARGPMKWLQDFLAPFYIFIKPSYRIRYHSRDEYLGDTQLVLHSDVRGRKKNLHSVFSVNQHGMVSWHINENGKDKLWKVQE